MTGQQAVREWLADLPSEDRKTVSRHIAKVSQPLAPLLSKHMATSSPSLHTLTIGTLIRSLDNVTRFLAKAEKHAARCKFDMANLMSARLYPDMFSLKEQLQYVCFLPVDFARHFADKPPPRVGYDEASLEDVRRSIKATIAYLKSVPPARLAERARSVVPVFFDSKKGMPAEDYAAGMIMPDFYFHMTAAYAILRHNGVALGKMDFIGPLKTKPLAARK